jgi:hypothetical protein
LKGEHMRRVTGILPALTLTLGIAANGWAAPLFTGSLCTPDVAGCDGQLVGNANWVDNIKFSWEISFDSGLWSYEYHFEDVDPGTEGNGPKDYSHLLIELSDNFTTDDFKPGSSSPSSDSPRTFDPSEPGNSNPGLPGALFGVKFNSGGGNPTGTDVILRIVTERAPVWGDFYAKDGKTDQSDNYVYNLGFTAADPGDDPADGSIDHHILRPDTRKGPPNEVAEPASLLLLGAGFTTLSLWRRRKNN